MTSHVSTRLTQKKHIHYDGEKYSAGLPWKIDHPPLPTNYNACEQRTRNMVNRLSPDTRAAYDTIIREQLKKQFIEKVTHDDNSAGHYIPHHAVRPPHLLLVRPCYTAQATRGCCLFTLASA